MKKLLILFIAALSTSMMFFSGTSAMAQTHVQQLSLKAPDGDNITGFIYQKAGTKKDAPLAILMHGMMGSSLYWLAGDNVSHGDLLSRNLVDQGYRVVALDARAHGVRKNAIRPLERLKGAKTGKPEHYLEMIEGTVGDYDILLSKMTKSFGKPQHVLVMGYSMGAQMAVLFAAQNDAVTHIVTMVPPAVKDVQKVAPVNHAANVKAKWLLITASQDQYASKADNDALVKAGGERLTRVEFDSKHMLPKSYSDAVITWVSAIETKAAITGE